MAGVCNAVTRTQSDAIAKDVSVKQCSVDLDRLLPDYMEKIPRYLESCVGQSRQDGASNGAAEAESDSGDSLFITQMPVPEAERSGRRRTFKLRSKPRYLEESEKDTSSSTSHDEEPKTRRKRRTFTKYKLPKYNFSFVTEQKFRNHHWIPDKDKSLLHYTMGGFFKCLRELREDPKSSLPTVDTDGEDISPLSEEDDDRSEGEDIKVVERKRLVEIVSLSKGTSRGRRAKTLHKNTAKTSTSKAVPVFSVTEGSNDEEASRRALVQRERKDQRATSDENFLAQTGTPKRTRHHTHEEASMPVTEPQTDASNETKEKKKKDKGHKENVEEGMGQSQEEPDGLLTREDGDIPDSIQKKKKRKKDKSAAENVGQEVDGSLESDVRVEDSNMEDDGKEKKKKRRKRSGEDVEQSQSGAVVEPLNDDAEMQKKKKKKKRKKDETFVITGEEEEAADRTLDLTQKKRKRSGEDAEQLESGAAVAESLNDDAEIQKKKKKKRKKDETFVIKGEEEEAADRTLDLMQKKRKKSGEDVEQSQSGAVAEPLNDDAEIQKKKKKKKRKKDETFVITGEEEEAADRTLDLTQKKRKRSGEDAEQLESDAAVAEPLNNDAEIQKKKKKKRKKEIIVITEEHEEEEAVDRTGRLEKSNCLENATASQETSDSSYVKRKKHKKKRQSSSNDATQDGEEGEDVSVCLDDSVTSVKRMSIKQKKKKTTFEWINSSYTHEENEKVDNTQEGLEDQIAELVTKKKEKKIKSEIFSRDISEYPAQSVDSVSVQEKNTTSSFLVADAEENGEKPGVSTGDLEELNDGVMKKKKKKKRKMLVAQDSVEKDSEQDFEEPKKSALPETTDTGLKKKQTGSGSEEERLEADAGLSPTDEAVVLKKKKKKKKYKDEQEGPPTASEDVESVALNTCSSVSHKKKGEHGAEISHDSSTTSDRASNKTLNAVEPGNQVLNDSRVKEKKKKSKSTDDVLLEGNSVNESAESRENEKKKRNKQPVPSIIETSLSKSEMSSDSIMKNKHRKVKRILHNPHEDFLSDCSC